MKLSCRVLGVSRRNVRGILFIGLEIFYLFWVLGDSPGRDNFSREKNPGGNGRGIRSVCVCVRIPVQDYKSLRVAVMISATKLSDISVTRKSADEAIVIA